MRPLRLALLPGLPWPGTVEVIGATTGLAKWLVTIDVVHEGRHHVFPKLLVRRDQLAEWTGVTLGAEHANQKL